MPLTFDSSTAVLNSVIFSLSGFSSDSSCSLLALCSLPDFSSNIRSERDLNSSFSSSRRVCHAFSCSCRARSCCPASSSCSRRKPSCISLFSASASASATRAVSASRRFSSTFPASRREAVHAPIAPPTINAAMISKYSISLFKKQHEIIVKDITVHGFSTGWRQSHNEAFHKRSRFFPEPLSSIYTAAFPIASGTKAFFAERGLKVCPTDGGPLPGS